MRLACPNQLSPTQNLLGNGMQASARNAAAGVTYATWNPLDKSANLTLSGGDLVVTQGGGSWSTVRSTISKTTGKWYWEVTVTTSSANNRQIAGICTSSQTLTSFIGNSTFGWSYYNNNGAPRKITGGVLTAYGINFVQGDVVGFYMDVDAGEVGFKVNNADQGTAFTGITGTLFAGVSLFDTSDVLTTNFGATALTYSPPAGYNSGLYS